MLRSLLCINNHSIYDEMKLYFCFKTNGINSNETCKRIYITFQICLTYFNFLQDDYIESSGRRYIDIHDATRGRNRLEDRLLSVRLKFYEREKNIRLNIIRKEQFQLRRARTSLYEEMNQIQIRKHTLTSPELLYSRSKSSQRRPTQLLKPVIVCYRWTAE